MAILEILKYMKKIVEKVVLVLLCVQVICLTACAKGDKIVTFAELPTVAQTFVETHFGKQNISIVMKDSEIFDTSYDVIMKDGSKVEFDKKGEWTSVKCINNAVPKVIVPQSISEYVSQNYPDVLITGIEKDKKEFEIHLSNRLELTFNKQGALIDIDD